MRPAYAQVLYQYPLRLLPVIEDPSSMKGLQGELLEDHIVQWVLNMNGTLGGVHAGTAYIKPVHAQFIIVQYMHVHIISNRRPV